MSNLVKKNEREDYLPVFTNRFLGNEFLNRFLGNEFYDDFFNGDVPAVNVKETKKAFTLEVSVPGYSKGDFNIDVDRNVLTISGRRTTENEEKDEDSKILRQEFTSKSFSRSFTLPEHINTDKIDAEEKNGVLKISLPKLSTAKENKTKKIEVK